MLALASLLSISPLGFSTAPTPEPTPACKTIAEILAETEYLSTLNTVVNAIPDALALLSDPALNLTVFAPNDTALLPFANFLNDALAEEEPIIPIVGSSRRLDHEDEDEYDVDKLLTGHVMYGISTAEALLAASRYGEDKEVEVTPVNGETIYLFETEPNSLSLGPVLAPPDAFCVDTNGNETDSAGDGCSWYTSNPWGCGINTATFFSYEMCCACGGGLVPAEQGAATVVVPNIKACNGIVHVIDKVLGGDDEDGDDDKDDDPWDPPSPNPECYSHEECGDFNVIAPIQELDVVIGLTRANVTDDALPFYCAAAPWGCQHCDDCFTFNDPFDGTCPSVCHQYANTTDDPWDPPFVECSSHEQCGDFFAPPDFGDFGDVIQPIANNVVDATNVTDYAPPFYCAVDVGCKHCSLCFLVDPIDGTCPPVCTDNGPSGTDLNLIVYPPGRRRLRAKKEGKFPTLKKEGKSGIKRRLQVGKKEGKFPTLKKEGKSGIKRRLQVGKKGGKAATSSTDIKHGI